MDASDMILIRVLAQPPPLAAAAAAEAGAAGRVTCGGRGSGAWEGDGDESGGLNLPGGSKRVTATPAHTLRTDEGNSGHASSNVGGI